MRKGGTVLFCLMVAAGCHDASQSPVQKAAPQARLAPDKRGPSPEALTAGMVEAVTNGSSTVPVVVKFELGGRPTRNEPLDVVVAVMPQIGADMAVLTANGSDGIKLSADAAPIEIRTVEPSQVYRHTIQVTPRKDGVQLLALSVSLTHDEITETRNFSVPLIVLARSDAAPGASSVH